MSEKKFQITHSSFLDFWFNTGADGDQHDMRTRIGYDAVESLEKRGEYTLTVQDLWGQCEWVRAWYIKDYKKHEDYILENYEDEEIWTDEIGLVPDKVYVHPEDEPYQECACCGEKHYAGHDVGYDKNFNVYCNNGECNEGVACHYGTLEPCWFDPEA